MWTYLICGAIPAVGGGVSAISPVGSNGLFLMLIGAVNLAVGGRIAYERRRLTAARLSVRERARPRGRPYLS